MATFQFPAVLRHRPFHAARTAHPLPLAFASFTLCILSLFGTPLHPFPSVKPFPVKSGGQLTVRIRTRSACIIYFQRALPSPTAETSGLEHGLPAISNSPIGIACHLLCFPSPSRRGTNNNSRLTDLSRCCSITESFVASRVVVAAAVARNIVVGEFPSFSAELSSQSNRTLVIFNIFHRWPLDL